MAEEAEEPVVVAGDYRGVLHACDCDPREAGEKRGAARRERVAEILGDAVDEFVGVHGDSSVATWADPRYRFGRANRVQEQCVEASADGAADADEYLLCEACGNAGDDCGVAFAVQCWSVF